MTTEFDPGRLLRHWFKNTRESPDQIEGRMQWWFAVDDSRDRWLADAHLKDCEAGLGGQLDCPIEDPHSRLALILLLDQIPRNLFRGTRRAFAGDEASLQLCLEGNAQNLDQRLTGIEKVFFWMPLQHVEDLKLQKLGLELYDSLAPADPYRSGLWKDFASYARLHHDIIERFGRFPHRNAVLGRESTPEETEYLQGGGQTFGQ